MVQFVSNCVIIGCALTGTATRREKNEHLPITPEEIAQDAYQCWQAGAAMVHLHMRDSNGNGVMDRDLFAQTIALIRARKDCDVIINCTSSGGPDRNGERTSTSRMSHFQTIPEIEVGSFDVGTFNWNDRYIFQNDPAFLKELAGVYQQCGVRPEIEVFDMGMLGNAKHYAHQLKLLEEPLWIQFVLGVLGGAEATVDNLLHLVRALPEGTRWSATGIGRGHLEILYTAIALGATGVRVGLEDNLYMRAGMLATNVALVERAAELIRLANKRPATPAEARTILGIPQLRKEASV